MIFKDLELQAELYNKFHEFFKSKNFLYVDTQHINSIISACENPNSITTFELGGQLWPCKQTSQMDLEVILLQNPQYDGVYCFTTSYRNEKEVVEGRHDLSFKMVEFESKGDITDLYNLEQELLHYFGFNDLVYDKRTYESVCQKFNVSEIGHDEETKIWNEISPVLFLTDFPERTSPFFNMKRNPDGTSRKIDVILYGMETIGSAERETDVDIMWESFRSISGGTYSAKLFHLFGHDRVMKELKEFLSLPMIPRFGGGMGLGRFIRAYKLCHQNNL